MPLTKDGERILAEYKTIYGVNGQTVFYSECLQNDGMANGKLCVVENCSGTGGMATEIDEVQPKKKKKRPEDKPGQLILGDKVMEDETKEEIDRIWGIAPSEQLDESVINEIIDMKRVEALNLGRLYEDVLLAIVKLKDKLDQDSRDTLQAAANIISKNRIQ